MPEVVEPLYLGAGFLPPMKQKDEDELGRIRRLLNRIGLSPALFFRDLFTRPEMWLVLLSNALIFFLPDFSLRDAITLIWIYIVQSLLLGLVHFFKLLFYRFAPEAQDGLVSRGGQRFTAFFFLVHFGFFHVVYIIFAGTESVKTELVMLAGLVYLSGQLLSLFREIPEENTGERRQSAFMMRPYARIIPIHFAVILGSLFGSAGIWLVLICLKLVMELLIVWLQLHWPAEGIEDKQG
jgi:hypothetical protein